MATDARADTPRTAAELPLLNKIVGDTYAHYAEHTGWIAEQLRA